jgi:DDE superfamily endonuclease
LFAIDLNLKPSSISISGSCSAIAALSTKGIEMVSMHDEMIDSETYLTVLENDVMPLMNPYPGEKSVLINDNAPVHNKAAIVTICDRFFVIPVFLEPYSYDYNPIELVFHSAKEYCRMHYPADDPNDPISKHFEEALKNLIDGDMVCDYFVHCHVKVTENERIRAMN